MGMSWGGHSSRPLATCGQWNLWFIMASKRLGLDMVYDGTRQSHGKEKTTPVSECRHECEPVSTMLIMVSHDAIWGVMPLYSLMKVGH